VATILFVLFAAIALHAARAGPLLQLDRAGPQPQLDLPPL
jgi:hypothetical protein